MPENTIITEQEFTYKVPNEVFSQDDSEGKTVTAKYTGPHRTWVFVDTDGDNKGKMSRVGADTEDASDGENIPVPTGTTRVEVTFADDPLILAIIGPGDTTLSYPGQSRVTEDIPGGGTWETNSKPEVLETYHGVSTLEYDLSAEEWKTPPYIPTPQTWDTLIATRNSMLESSDSKISPDMPDSVKAPWVAYRAALRDLPTTYRRGESDEVEPWKVPMPLAPDTKV